MKPESIKLSEENIKPLWSYVGQRFFRKGTKCIIYKQTEKFSSSKFKSSVIWQTMLKEWRQTKSWEKIFASPASGKELISKIYKKLSKHTKETKNPK